MWVAAIATRFEEIMSMAIAIAVEDYMARHGLTTYDIIRHPQSHFSMETAELAHVPGECLAKSVILEDDDGYLMMVLPSTRHVKLGALSRDLQRQLRLATELELAQLFKDCEPGAIPPVGEAYGLETLIDESLADKPDVYFEAGNHQELIHVDGDSFMRMMASARRIQLSQRI
jgi:Ala-tRNA(Pro) deacylase